MDETKLYINSSNDNQSKTREAVEIREHLKTRAQRIVVKVGSAIITRENGKLSAPRMSSIVQQIADLQQEGRQMLLVSSGAVAFGRKELKDTESSTNVSAQKVPQEVENRLAAAIGQSSLMSFYKILFHQYDCKVAQVLVTKADLRNEASRRQLRSTILGLLDRNIVPIVNTNDAIENLVTSNLNNGVLDLKQGDMTDIIVEDNDSLAAILAVEIQSDLLVMLSNVDGIYSAPPGRKESYFLPTFNLNIEQTVTYGDKSSVGSGGMGAKVRSAVWALKRGTSVVVCNGSTSDSVSRVVHGERLGTFFTNSECEIESSRSVQMVRNGSRMLNSIGLEKRSKIIMDIASALDHNKELILKENERDLIIAKEQGLENVLLSRLKLTDGKLASLVSGLNQIASQSKDQVDKVLKTVKISDTIQLRQVTCPIGVLLVIFESRPDCLPQISALSIATANGLLLKGGKEAYHSNLCLYNIIKDVLKKYDCQEAIQLVDSREKVNELIKLGDNIDLIIPRGSKQLVQSIQQKAESTPVLGHSEGICHVYIDKDMDEEKAIRIVLDSKCGYPAACNAMETLLIHQSLVKTDFMIKLIDELRKKQVKINAGPQLQKVMTLDGSARIYNVEYGTLECTLEVVNTLDSAILHINQFGSAHTDAIVTTNEQAAKEFEMNVKSASVFVNCSTRFADGYRYGLGAEVGISTSKLHPRGPAGMDSLLSYKWILTGSGDTVGDYEITGVKKYIHEKISRPN